MATLHTVNKSPFQDHALISCLKHVKDGDFILMIEDGVYGALSGTSQSESVLELGKNISLFALDADVASRGLDLAKILGGVTLIDYAGFVDLVTKTERIQNWL